MVTPMSAKDMAFVSNAYGRIIKINGNGRSSSQTLIAMLLVYSEQQLVDGIYL